MIVRIPFQDDETKVRGTLDVDGSRILNFYGSRYVMVGDRFCKVLYPKRYLVMGFLLRAWRELWRPLHWLYGKGHDALDWSDRTPKEWVRG